MSKKVRLQSFDSEIIYNSEQSYNEKQQCSNSFINGVLEKQMDSAESTKIKKQRTSKTIQKKGKLIVKSGKWSGANRINYYKGILKFSIQHPYYKISWRYWKPQKFYPRMVEQINKKQQYYKKDVIQTKSFDQRQRKQYFQKAPKLDMIELAIEKLKQIQLVDYQAKQILNSYQSKTKQKSVHMEKLDGALKRLKQKKYQIEDAYASIMGEEIVMVNQQVNSCFYS